MRGCDADHTARAGNRIARARGALRASLDTSGRGRLPPLGAFVGSLQNCGSIHLATASGGLTGREQNRNIGPWTTATASPLYPFVVVRIACRVCSRNGAYRLARLAAKFRSEISLRDLLDRFSYDCL